MNVYFTFSKFVLFFFHFKDEIHTNIKLYTFSKKRIFFVCFVCNQLKAFWCYSVAKFQTTSPRTLLNNRSVLCFLTQKLRVGVNNNDRVICSFYFFAYNHKLQLITQVMKKDF